MRYFPRVALAVSALATLSLATAAEAQMYGQGQGPSQGGGGMMGGNWGWVMVWADTEESACSLWSFWVLLSWRSVAAIRERYYYLAGFPAPFPPTIGFRGRYKLLFATLEVSHAAKH